MYNYSIDLQMLLLEKNKAFFELFAEENQCSKNREKAVKNI